MASAVERNRLWCFTQYDLSFNYQSIIDDTNNDIRYIAYSNEICPSTKRPHHQGFIYFFEKKQSYKKIGKMLGKSNCRPCKGNLEQNEDYCSKVNKLTEFGDRPSQGERKDLTQMKDDILTGVISAEDIIEINPVLYHQYGRTIDKMEDMALRKKYRNFMTEGYWYFGETGTGKSEHIFKDFNPSTHYVFPDDNGWWDGYKGQEIVIFDDFRGNTIAYAELLKLCDKYPKTVKRRNREPVPFLAKRIYITSSLHPDCIYTNLHHDDKLEQLYRRFKIIELTKTAQKCLGGNTDP